MVIRKLPLGASEQNKAHKEYEQAGIFAFRYNLKSLPSNNQLEKDYLLFLDFYQEIITDPFMPSMDDLIFSAYKEKSGEVDIVINFEPFSKRVVKPSRKTGNYFGGTDSKNAKHIGDVAEKLVYESEIDKLIKAGRDDLADKVIHEEAEKNRPGWDISSYDIDGTPMHIEVKASSSNTINSVVITANEWSAANNLKYKENYYLYLVRNALTDNPTVEPLRDPALWVENKEFQITPSQYLLKLFK